MENTQYENSSSSFRNLNQNIEKNQLRKSRHLAIRNKEKKKKLIKIQKGTNYNIVLRNIKVIFNFLLNYMLHKFENMEPMYITPLRAFYYIIHGISVILATKYQNIEFSSTLIVFTSLEIMTCPKNIFHCHFLFVQILLLAKSKEYFCFFSHSCL